MATFYTFAITFNNIFAIYFALGTFAPRIDIIWIIYTNSNFFIQNVAMTTRRFNSAAASHRLPTVAFISSIVKRICQKCSIPLVMLLRFVPNAQKLALEFLCQLLFPCLKTFRLLGWRKATELPTIFTLVRLKFVFSLQSNYFFCLAQSFHKCLMSQRSSVVFGCRQSAQGSNYLLFFN